jgi:hypothetical protein
MSITEKLLFFNKEGYPYNFTFNNNTWNGKLFFDPGSTDIFKSESIYVLEEVDPIEYSNTIDIVNDELYNDSGMTISPFTYENIEVIGIKVVNQSDKFYTKWISGDQLNRKFPVTTVISFEGTVTPGSTGATDFDSNNYFMVLQTKKNSIMIATDTSNDLFNFDNCKFENLRVSDTTIDKFSLTVQANIQKAMVFAQGSFFNCITNFHNKLCNRCSEGVAKLY